MNLPEDQFQLAPGVGGGARKGVSAVQGGQRGQSAESLCDELHCHICFSLFVFEP